MDGQKNSLAEEIEELRKQNAELMAANQVVRQQAESQTVLFGVYADNQADANLFTSAADNLPVIIWTADANGEVDYFNRCWYEFTGQTTQAAHCWGWQSVLHPDDLQVTLDTWSNSLLTGSPYQIEYRFKRAGDGAYIWHLGKAAPVKDENGNVLKWFGTCTNIQEQKEAQSKKDEFISIASHELKTPLTTVKASLQIANSLIKPQEPASVFTHKASVQLQRLEKLIADLLDVSKINAGKMIYHLEEFDFNQALEEAVENVQQTATQHKISLETTEHVLVKGDRLRLEQVVNNLLTNAIKYSPDANAIIVRSKVEDNSVIVSVQDFGIGIAPENLEKLFDRYYRVENSSARFQGLGLGLFISSEIIKKHHGSFWIESEEGTGSTFYFLLPVSGQSQPAAEATDKQTYYQNKSISVRYNNQSKWLEVDWTGYQNYASVKNGCLVMLDFIRKNHCRKVLNDNTHVTGNWSEAVDWLSDIWFPAARAAGLQQLAWILSSSTFSRMSANKSVHTETGVETRFFLSKSDAVKWLAEGQASED